MATYPRPDVRTRYAWRAAALTAVATLVSVVLFVVLVRDALGWDFEAATRSPLAEQPFGPRYGGWLGSFGVLGWTLAAAVTALAAAVCWRRGARAEATFLLSSSVLSAVLLFNDLFMIHSTVLPRLFGIPKPAVLIGLVMLTGVWAAVHAGRLVDDPDLPILIWAGIWYAVALGIDAFGERIGWGGVREEAAKLVGVASWLVFLWRTSLRAVERGERDLS